jgi:molybdopterin synthase sulfur carrier subunit
MSDGAPVRATDPAAAVPMVVVRIPGPLRQLAGGADEVVVEAVTVGAAIDRIVERHPGLRRHLRAERGGLRDHVNVFLNEDDIRFAGGEGARIAPGDAITIVPSIAGG